MVLDAYLKRERKVRRKLRVKMKQRQTLKNKLKKYTSLHKMRKKTGLYLIQLVILAGSVKQTTEIFLSLSPY